MTSQIFVCPLCKGLLQSTDSKFHCASCARDYPIVDDIPDFFIPELNQEGDAAWCDNQVWLDPQMVEAREIIYRLSVRQLKGVSYAMQQLGLRTFPGCRILEVGMGTGHFTRWMGEVVARGTEIFAFDYSWPMFAKARANLAGQSGVILLRANAIGKLPFLEESFDLIFLRLAPLCPAGKSSTQAAFHWLKPGGWLFKAGWAAPHQELPWIEEALQLGYESAEMHQWQYPRTKTEAEYAASRVESERAIAFGAPFKLLPAVPESLVTMTTENLRIAQKPIR